MSSKHALTLTLVAVSAALLATPAPVRAQTRSMTPRQGSTASPAMVSAEEFRSLRWILGRWAGTGGGGLASVPPFFEEYTALDDSTIVMRSYRDSTFGAMTETHNIEWRNGRVTSGGQFVARMARDTVEFRSRGNDHYYFVRVSASEWRAVFPPRQAGEPQRWYEMRRIGRAP